MNGFSIDDVQVKFLPDLKAALNEFDEPRVLIPHDQLANPLPAKSASTDTSINPMYFNMQDKQRVWESITISCPPDSNARSDTSSPTTTKPYLELPFVANLSDTQNICKWPSSASTKHGFLSSPSTFHFTHHRVPIMATARLATFHDVLMPSSYYFQSDIAAADDKKDTPWEKKKDLVYCKFGLLSPSQSVPQTLFFHTQTLIMNIRARHRYRWPLDQTLLEIRSSPTFCELHKQRRATNNSSPTNSFFQKLEILHHNNEHPPLQVPRQILKLHPMRRIRLSRANRLLPQSPHRLQRRRRQL
jgi:hypothetical protein